MSQSVEQLKQEISEQYIKDFKKELWWLKSLALFPIEKKIKKILSWELNLPDKFNEVEEFWWWKDVINFVSPDMARRIFEFMKEKRSKNYKNSRVKFYDNQFNKLLIHERKSNSEDNNSLNNKLLSKNQHKNSLHRIEKKKKIRQILV